eukprot:COSAG06_NODE_53643_length_299_cov_0.575000_1_plen_45_part_01
MESDQEILFGSLLDGYTAHFLCGHSDDLPCGSSDRVSDHVSDHVS